MCCLWFSRQRSQQTRAEVYFLGFTGVSEVTGVSGVSEVTGVSGAAGTTGDNRLDGAHPIYYAIALKSWAATRKYINTNKKMRLSPKFRDSLLLKICVYNRPFTTLYRNRRV